MHNMSSRTGDHRTGSAWAWVVGILPSLHVVHSVRSAIRASRDSGRVRPERKEQSWKMCRLSTSAWSRSLTTSRTDQVGGVLHRTGRLLGGHERFAEIVLRQVADIINPKIHELGLGCGCLSGKLLDNHPRPEVTAADTDPIVEVPDV